MNLKSQFGGSCATCNNAHLAHPVVALFDKYKCRYAFIRHLKIFLTVFPYNNNYHDNNNKQILAINK